MADELKPALSADEWRLLRYWLAGKMPGGRVRGKVVMDLPEDHQVAAIAVASACLPDDSRYKITRDDVAFLRDASVHRVDCGSFGDMNPSTTECDCGGPEWAARFASKLAALLPPDTLASAHSEAVTP